MRGPWMLALGLWLGADVGACAQRLVAEYDWAKIATDGRPGVVTPGTNGSGVLTIRGTNETGLRVQLMTIPAPPIRRPVYVLRGQVRYENVRGAGFLEMWSHFPPTKPGLPEAQYFSRTLGESGPMGRLTGSSEWREFQLPFDATGAASAPTRLEVAMILPSTGTVQLSSCELVEFGDETGFGVSASVRPWWPRRYASWAGSLLGTVIGGLGGLLGWLGGSGRARSFVMATLKGLVAFGVLALVFGVTAAVCRQPAWIWGPPVGTGVLLLVILPPQFRVFARRYEELELRKMNAADVLSG